MEDRMKEQDYPTRKQVMERLLSEWNIQWGSETIRTEDAIGRVPSEDQYARHSLPVVRAAGMDSIAVRSKDFLEGMPDTSVWRTGKEFVRADTGDDFDDRYDAVIAVEDVEFLPEGGLLLRPDIKIYAGLGVRPKGSTMKKGELLVQKGRPLRSVDLAALVMGGVTELPVYQKPRVAFIPTGSELLPAGAPLERGKTYDSNSILARHMLEEMGACAVLFPIVRDDKEKIRETLEQAMKQADIVILNGGSSKGDEDHNARLLKEQGQVICHGVAAAPGKPMCVAVLDKTPVINMPGPPLAVFYGMDWCIRGLICHLLHTPVPVRRTVEGVLTEDISTPPHMEILCKMNVKKTDQGYETAQVPFKKCTVVEALCSDALYITKRGTDGNKAGEHIRVELLSDVEF